MMAIDRNSYLCQVGDGVSCGACCGLYNVADPSREAIAAMLTRRSEWFEATARKMDDILAFADRVERTEGRDRPLPDFHHCPYLGLVGENRSRAGCLLHPLGRENRNVDWRGLSYYGGMACREYFCPSARNLPDVYGKMLKQAASDWYSYGLIITEEAMIRAFFREVERRLGRPFAGNDLDAPELNDAVREFVEIKIRWRFRRSPHDGLRHYFFRDPPRERPPVVYQNIGAGPSPYDAIFRELCTAFDSPEELARAEAVVSGMADRIADRLGR